MPEPSYSANRVPLFGVIVAVVCLTLCCAIFGNWAPSKHQAQYKHEAQASVLRAQRSDGSRRQLRRASEIENTSTKRKRVCRLRNRLTAHAASYGYDYCQSTRLESPQSCSKR